MDMVRITVAKAFNSGLFDQAKAGPSRLAALALPASLLPRVMRTLGITATAEEVSCLVRVRKEEVIDFCKATIPLGAFVQEHTSKESRFTAAAESKPRWCERQESCTALQYIQHVSALALDCGARMYYRS